MERSPLSITYVASVIVDSIVIDFWKQLKGEKHDKYVFVDFLVLVGSVAVWTKRNILHKIDR